MAGDRGSRWARRIVVILAVVVSIAVVLRLVVDPVAAHYTRKALAESDAVRGDFSSVHVTLFPPGYEVRKLKVVPRDDPDWEHPALYAKQVKVTIVPKHLLRLHLVARARVDRAKVTVTAPPHEVKKEVKEQAPEALEAPSALRRLLPARLERVEVRKSELLYRDPSMPNEPEIWIHDIAAVIENLATRASLAGGRPTTLSASGIIGKSGQMTLFVSADPLARKLDFAGSLTVRGWHVSELYDLLEPRTQLQTPEGTMDVYAEWKVRDGVISGGVKPVMKDVTVRPTKQSLGNRLKAWLADKGLHIFRDEVPGRNAVATVVPIEGRLDSPDIQLWPAVLGVVRNAFVEGVSAGFANLPPGAASKKEGPLEQAGHAVRKSAGPPKAQPTGNDGKKEKP